MNKPVKLSAIHHAEEKWQGQFMAQLGWQVVQMFSSVELETAVARQSVAVCEQSHNGKIRVEGPSAGRLLHVGELAVHAGQQTKHGHVYRLRPDLYFVHIGVKSDGHTPALNVDEVALTLAQDAQTNPDLITVTDVTHGLAELWLVGPRSAELLSRLCGLDFHNSRFPNGAAKQSSVAKTAQLIIRHDQGDVPAYALIGPRSLGAYLWQTIMQAGSDLAVQPIGQAALEQLP